MKTKAKVKSSLKKLVHLNKGCECVGTCKFKYMCIWLIKKRGKNNNPINELWKKLNNIKMATTNVVDKIKFKKWTSTLLKKRHFWFDNWTRQKGRKKINKFAFNVRWYQFGWSSKAEMAKAKRKKWRSDWWSIVFKMIAWK